MSDCHGQRVELIGYINVVKFVKVSGICTTKGFGSYFSCMSICDCSPKGCNIDRFGTGSVLVPFCGRNNEIRAVP